MIQTHHNFKGTPNPNKPLDRGFNVAVQHMADLLHPVGFDVSDEAPETYEALVHYYNVTRRVKVWSGASERTIFDDREINYAFRAWHDHRHIVLHEPFTDAGELAVLKQQQQDILTVYGDNDRSRYWLDILEGEVKGQLEHKKKYGAWPVDQKGFVEAYIANKFIALNRLW